MQIRSSVFFTAIQWAVRSNSASCNYWHATPFLHQVVKEVYWEFAKVIGNDVIWTLALLIFSVSSVFFAFIEFSLALSLLLFVSEEEAAAPVENMVQGWWCFDLGETDLIAQPQSPHFWFRIKRQIQICAWFSSTGSWLRGLETLCSISFLRGLKFDYRLGSGWIHMVTDG